MERARMSVNADWAHNNNYFGRGVTIAVLDTGLFMHQDFDKSRIKGFKDFINMKNSVYDDCGHGTHIAGIIAGSGRASKGRLRGIAPDANLFIVKALDLEGNGKLTSVVNAIDWLIENMERLSIQIVNISMGSTMKMKKGETTLLVNAVERLWDAGMVVCVAAGNSGPGFGTITIPGISPKVITVGYISDRISLCGQGPTKNCIVKPEIVAPGEDILSCDVTYTGYTKKSGSSMATPIVSGAIALLLEKYPDMTNKDVKKRLYERAIDIGYPKNIQGWGYLDIKRLLW